MYMKNYPMIASLCSFLALFLIPSVLYAQIGIPCDGPDCTFDSLIQLVNNIIKFLMYGVAIPLAALGFMFVGAKMVLSPNKESAKTEAKESFGNIIKGFLIMLSSYLLIKTGLFLLMDEKQQTLIKFLFE